MPVYDYCYLKNLIENKVEENLHLDYKAAAALDKQNNKTTEISKDVSALANSDGGILIYGVIEDEIDKHLPKEINPINRKMFPKEWLEQIIQDKIQPRINNFKIHSVEIESDHVVYIVEIDKSFTAHQAFDKRYYKRFNFQSTAMYDYEVRDILNRAKNPIISLEFEFENNYSQMIVFARNLGSVYAKYLNVKIRLPSKIVGNKYYKKVNNETIEIFVDNTIRDLPIRIGLVKVNENFAPKRYVPILPTLRIKITIIKLVDYPLDYDNIMECEIYCDNSEPKFERIRLANLLKK